MTSTNSEAKSRLERLLGFLQHDTQNLSLVLDALECAIECKDPERAEMLIARGQELDSHHPRLKYQEGIFRMAKGQFPEAKACFDALMASGVIDESIQYNRAYCEFFMQEFAAAEQTLESILVCSPPLLPMKNLLLAKVKHYLGNADAALELVNSVLDPTTDTRLSPRQSLEALELQTLLLLDLSEFEQAQKNADTILKQKPDSWEGLMTQGYLQLNALDLELAIDSLQSSLKTKPNSGRSWVGVGLAQMGQMKLAEAIESLEKGLALLPQQPGMWNALAWACICIDDIDRAEKNILNALEHERNFGETHGVYAVVLILKGQIDAARERIRLAQGLDKDSFAAQFAQSLLVSTQGHPQRAQRMVKKILESPVQEDGTRLVDLMVSFQKKRQG